MESGHILLERMLRDKNAEPTDMPISLLKSITKNFIDAQKIGCGGFAVVYKGLLENGGVVAVKKLSNSIDFDENKYIQEVNCLMRGKHKNIVRFLGYCADTQGKMLDNEGKFVMADVRERLLCFEYVPNGTLIDYITDASNGLEWRTRYQIIKGICEGLHYLHKMRIVHLDLKPGNILLDYNMVPKITDFGISRCFDQEQSWVIASKIVGTLGYMAPESFTTRKITTKLDIYSLGFIIIEILTGEKGYCSVENVLESWRNRLKTSSAIGAVLEQIRVCFGISMDCIHFNPEKRPTTQRILELLEKTECADKFNETNLQAPAPGGGSSKARQVQAEIARRNHAEAIKQARLLPDDGQLDDARGKLVDAQKALEEIVLDRLDDGPKLVQLLKLMETDDLYEAQGRAYALAFETSHGRQRYAARRGDPDDVRLFATPRMDAYREQAKNFEKDPTAPVPSTSETSHGRQRFATRGGDEDEVRLFATPRMDAYREQAKNFEGRPYALASETSHGRQRFAARGGDEDEVRLFATPRMDAYREQAKNFEKDPTAPVLFASETSHGRQRFAARGSDEDEVRLFATPRMDAYREQAKNFEKDPTALVSSASETSHGHQRFATRGGDEDEVRLFATPRMDAYREQAKNFEKDPTASVPSADETSHGRQRFAARVGDEDEVRLFATPRMDAYREQAKNLEGRPYALASETSHGRQRFAARGGDEDEVHLFATPRMDTYREQAKNFEKDPTAPVLSANETSHGHQRFAARGSDEDEVRLFAMPRMDAYREQAKNFEKYPIAPVPSADENVKQELAANPLAAISTEVQANEKILDASP